ncbi:MAG: hypothetical protein CSA54_03785 [Gammaproteobacteria bacterium]|nr:MAG: hypothetical protein CSA54_03785 [Gammaproteobacteria bacterium]
MLNTFRILSLVEGTSLVVLCFIAMPLKYQLGVQGVVPVVGMLHGLLWMAYVVMSLSVSHVEKWSVGFWLLVLLASVIPGACLLLDKKLKSAIKTTPAQSPSSV